MRHLGIKGEVMNNEARARWTVLVVDDDAHHYATRGTLAVHGYATLEAHDGETALDLARQADAVVLAIAMPAMSGLDVCAALRDVDHDKELVIIQYSGVFTSSADSVAGLISGADAYLTKSRDADVLLANLDAQLRKLDRLRQLEAEHHQ